MPEAEGDHFVAGLQGSNIVSLCERSAAPCVSVIVPVFNERSTVHTVLTRVLEEQTRKEVIIVDDGSDDGTGELLEDWIRGYPPLGDSTVRVLLLRHATNRGKGRAIRTAVAYARGTFVIVQDADLELRPSCYSALLSPLVDGTAEFVIGRRLPVSRFSLHAVGIATLGGLIRILYGYSIQDAACCFKVLSLANLRRMNLEAERFEFCPEVIAKASKLGLALRQVEVEYFPRAASEGKKLRLIKDGLKAIATLLRYRDWQVESGC